MAELNAELRDGFNRSDELLEAGANWSLTFGVLGGSLAVVSNQCEVDHLDNGTASNYWSAATFGPDCVAYYQLKTLPANGSYASIFLRGQDMGGLGFDCYSVRLTMASGDDTVTIRRIDDAATGEILDTITQAFSADDWLGIRAIGSEISAWRQSGGVWTMLGSGSDDTYSTGYAGIGSNDATTPTALDTFHAGTIRTIPIIMHHLQQQKVA